MPTPHINAADGDFAPVCLMPGDPRRARHIAETFLTDARLVTDVRSIEGFTGTFEGRPVSVMAHGMGIPSCSIYATELVQHYGVRSLVRVGSCGSIREDLPLRSVVVALGASTDSMVNRTRFRGYDFAAVADFALARAAVDAAAALEVPVQVGNVFSSDLFYAPDPSINEVAAGLGILAVEMEAAGLYGVAAETGARALTLLTVSDHIVTGEHLSPEDRQHTFDDMVRIALATAIADA
ncbi:purine-nucleoside phosphorylase [Iamia sp. SCSIO 61187]|uniref:purine-nucleoside phosphorylase n=1 Tax=Iamia sp. SCSIO 61187 TaxID=2722752 RepID=UPI001C63934F|nr:purine-nucleoside phosphorylase [Iamia sp. SCSIO 61187]QYG92753.1 purine-nucleoside phosphorylase [Iamia sp. SCSIO 61187]